MTCKIGKADPVLVEKLVRQRAQRESRDEEWIRQEVERMKNATMIACSRKKG